MRAGPIVAMLVGAVLGTSCERRAPRAEETIEAFLSAVREQDVDALACLMAGAAEAGEPGDRPEARRAAFEQWALGRLAAYELERDEGRVELDGTGVVLARLFGLGRGTFYSVERVTPAGDDGLVADSRLRFGYGSVDLSRFTPGTTFYVAGAPPGRVHAVRVPAGAREIGLDVLDEIWVRWSLLREEATGDCPAGWKVAGAEPVEGTARTTEVTWIF